MRFGYISFISSFVAIPLAYFPIRHYFYPQKLNPQEKNEYQPVSSIRLDKLEWTNWIEQSYQDGSKTKKQHVWCSSVDFKQALIGYVCTYLVLKLITKVARLLSLFAVTSILL